MSCVGMVIGAPCAGDRMLLDDSIRVDASICASGDSGMGTAIWSPSKSALNAVQTSGGILIALPSTSTGSNAGIPIERAENQRVNLDRLACLRSRLKRLNPEPVQGGRAIQQNRMVLDALFQDVPHHRVLLLHQFLGLLDGGAVAALFEAVIDERLEQLQRHLLGKAALMELQLRTHHDHRTARVVDALAEQVLAETALLALE